MDNRELKEIIVYTDGACAGNPGKGGWGATLTYCAGKKEHRKEIYGGYRSTTNNRMELMAVVESLRCLKERCRVVIHTDSQYITNAFNAGWLANWQAKLWKNVKNIDLWQQLLAQTKRHQASFVWVKGHNGHPQQEYSDYLANLGLKSKNLLVDWVYEQKSVQENLFDKLSA